MKDLSGKIFGNNTVLKISNNRSKDGRILWICRCVCGKIRELRSDTVKGGRKCSSCSKINNIIGYRYGSGVVIALHSKTKYGVRWELKCDCGNKYYAISSNLNNKSTKSCGCYRSKKSANICQERRGENHHWYNHQLTKMDRLREREGMHYFRTEVFKRDNYTCVVCEKRGGDLIAHHLNGYHWCIEGREDIKNGVCVCDNCHNLFHYKYGRKNNTMFQFIEFMESTRWQ